MERIRSKPAAPRGADLEREHASRTERPLLPVQRMQQQIGNQAVVRAMRGGGGLGARIQSRLGSGRRLPDGVQQQLEHGLGGSLDQVRVHTDGHADDLARSLHAHAFTTGADIFFRAGRFDPGSSKGMHVLAHEASHTLQQARGQVDGQSHDGVRLSTPGDRHERAADADAARVARGEPAPTPAPAARRSDAPVAQRLADGHGHACGCAGCRGLVVQRFPDMVDLTPALWVDESKVARARRSEEFRRIDAAVEEWNEHRELPARIKDRVDALTQILKAIDEWRTARAARVTSKVEKWSVSEREPAVADLETAAAALLVVEKQRLAEKEAADAKVNETMARGRLMDSRYAQYVKQTTEFTNYSNAMSKYDEDKAITPLLILARQRGANDALTRESVELMNQYEAKSIANTIKKSEDSAVELADDVGTAKLRELAENATNSVTGQTELPELKNLYEPNDQQSEVVTEGVDMGGGVSWAVTYDPSDVNFETKFAAVKSAVKLVVDRGFTPPDLRLHMPKYGRSLTVTAGGCQEKNKTERAMFTAPDFLHISSNALGIPIETLATGWKQGQEHINQGYKYSSTVLDPSGVATMVHEIGHAMHYDNSPDRYYGLFMTNFATEELVTKANDQVSEYGNRPREFVAEVFLGLVYRRTYSDDIMRMYVALGGALPDDLVVKYESEDSVKL